MKLYYTRGACSLAPHIVACEAGVALGLEKVDLGTKKTESGRDYRQVNPKGYVPALEMDDGTLLTEVGAIIQYLAERNEAARLVPPGKGLDHYRELEWITFVSSEIHKGYAPLFDPDAAEDAKARVKDRLARRLAYVEEAIGDRPHLMGEAFTAADAYLFTILSWSKTTGVDLSPYPRLRGFMRRVAARPKVKQAMRAEGLLA